MHQDVGLGGPVIWFFYIATAISVGGALYQLVDIARRRDADYGPGGRAVWLPVPVMLIFGLFGALIGGLVGFAPVLTPAYGGFLFFAMVACLVQLPAYLLRVTFPSPKRALERAAVAGEPAPEWARDALEDRDSEQE